MKYFFNTLTAVYIVLFSISLLSCNGTSEQTSAFMKRKEFKKEQINYLKEKYTAKLFTDSTESVNSDYQLKILNSTVVLDTNIRYVERAGKEYYMDVVVNSDQSGKILAHLKCSEEIADVYRHYKSTAVIIAADIEKIIKEEALAETDSIKGNKIGSIIKVGNNIFLTGLCREIVEIPQLEFFKEES